MDRISNLPNEIICHIVSFLSAKEAAFALILSKRWQNLFTIVIKLQFDDSVKNEGSLKDFVDGVLALPTSSRVRSCSLECRREFDPTHYDDFNRCICALLKRGILDLKLDICAGRRYSLPLEVFTCKTLVKLELGSDFGGFVVDLVPEDAFLPALETLLLNYIRFKDLRRCAFEKLLSACLVLKELVIHNMEWERWKWSGNISSPTLERLTISHVDLYECEFTRINLDTPNLTYLELSDAVPDDYPIVNLDSLVEVKLDLTLMVDHKYHGYVDDNDTISSNPTNLINGLRNVEIMNLQSPNTFQAFSYFHEAIPVFKNLYHLTITNNDTVIGFCWEFLPFVIKKCPNLKTLVIDGPLHYNEDRPKSVCHCLSGYSFLLSCPLEVLQITDYSGTPGEVEQLKHFLEKLSGLKLVKLHSLTRFGSDKKKLLMLPRASSKCKIKHYDSLENALLPSLKTLILDSVKFYDRCGCCAFQKLLSACPVLVESVMRNLEWEDWEWSGCASSQTLERLTIDHRYWAEHNLESFTFDTPSLTYLDYNAHVPGSYPTVNLDSLVEAKLNLGFTTDLVEDDDDPFTSDPTNLIKGLRNVEILRLWMKKGARRRLTLRNH
ncbi:F-box/LRR-repeat protein [Arabidopsis thaliana]